MTAIDILRTFFYRFFLYIIQEQQPFVIKKKKIKPCCVCSGTAEQCVYDYFNSYSNDMWCCSRRWRRCCQHDCSLACYREINKFKSVALHNGSLICYLSLFGFRKTKTKIIIIKKKNRLSHYLLYYWPASSDNKQSEGLHFVSLAIIFHRCRIC